MEGALLALVLLACPVGMGLMMWFMGKGGKQQSNEAGAAAPKSVEQLREEQRRLEAEIADRERGLAESGR